MGLAKEIAMAQAFGSGGGGGGSAADTRFKDLVEGTLTEINDNEITDIRSYSFSHLATLITANFTQVTSIGIYAFSDCLALTTINLPLATTIKNYAFFYCTALITADLSSVTFIGGFTFSGCENLTSLILRKSNVCHLANINAFNNTPISKGTGYIYVPSALLDSYKAATTWSTYANQFRALEDYTVDGTITGALDETKI